MKTIAVLTDFSPASEHAAQYAMHLAQKTKANVALYAASPVSSGAAMMAAVGWADDADDEVPANNVNTLDEFAERLYNYHNKRSFPGSFLPLIDICRDEDVTNSFLSLEDDKDVSLLVIAASPCDGHDCSVMAAARWRTAIDAAAVPVLVVPENAAIRNVERFVFATDALSHDIDYVNKLSNWATFSTAEIMVASAKNEMTPEAAIASFKAQLLSGVDYGRLYFRAVTATPVKNELEWLIENRGFDMLAMGHRKGVLSNLLFNRGMLEALLYRKGVPVLVYPDAAGLFKNNSSAKRILSINIHDHETYDERRIA